MEEDEDVSFYSGDALDDSIDNDEISPEEEGFMKGYMEEEDDEDDTKREEEAV